MTRTTIRLLTLIALSTLTAGCFGNSSSSNPNPPSTSVNAFSLASPSVLAAGVAGGITAQASGQNVGLNLKRFSLFETEALAASACPTYAGGVSCDGTNNQQTTLVYNGCSFGSSSTTWQGAQILTFGGTAICGTTNLPIVNAGDTLQRAFVGAIPAQNATTQTLGGSGIVVQLDTTTPTGYSLPVSGGELIAGTGTGQVITIQGLHIVSGTLIDESVSTATGQPLAVSNPGATRQITSGTLVLQNNLNLSTATSVFSSVAFNGTDCVPQSGTIITALSGALSGTETLVFNGGRSATLTSASGQTNTFTLAQCF